MANPEFGKNLSFCGTSSRVFTRFVVALVIVNKYNLYVQYLVIIENPRKLREKRRGGPGLEPWKGSTQAGEWRGAVEDLGRNDRFFSTTRHRAKRTARPGRIGHGSATDQMVNLSMT
jgi:hypothetical protein